MSAMTAWKKANIDFSIRKRSRSSFHKPRKGNAVGEATRPIPAPHVLSIDPYVPGKVLDPSVIQLASNENAWGPSPRAVRALRDSSERCHRYPEGSGAYLREALSQRLAIPASNIILGNGSTEIVEIIARTYLNPGDNAITADQTFVMYR